MRTHHSTAGIIAGPAATTDLHRILIDDRQRTLRAAATRARWRRRLVQSPAPPIDIEPFDI